MNKAVLMAALTGCVLVPLAQILVVPAALFLTVRLFEGTEVRHAGTMANFQRPLSHV